MKLSSTFEKLSREFKIKFDELSAEIEHPLLAGEAREHALVGLLTQYLPQRVGVDRGFVIDAHGRQSQQIDVVIYDRTVGTVFEINKIKFFPCETVIAVGEVKSDIEAVGKLQDALGKIKSVKELDRSNNGHNLVISGPGVSITGLEFSPATRHRDQIFGFIFTSTSLSRDTLISHLQNYNKNTERRFWMNLFCGFNRYLISYERSTGLYPSAMDATYMYCTKDEETPNLLLLFYCILAQAISEIHVASPHFFSYASIDKTIATYHDVMESPSQG
jgi:hypothetical protein